MFASWHFPAPPQLGRQFDLGQLAFNGVSREEKERHRALIAEQGSFMGYKVRPTLQASSVLRLTMQSRAYSCRIIGRLKTESEIGSNTTIFIKISASLL